MSSKYAEDRIEKALKLAKGNVVKARAYVTSWAKEDPGLLEALTKNHMTGIVAYHVDRVAAGRHKPKKPSKKALKKTLIPDGGDAFGMEILKAVVDSNAALFGLEGDAAHHKGGRTSKEHIDAIRKLAGKPSSDTW